MRFITSLHPVLRIIFIFLVAVASHIVVREIKHLTRWILTPGIREGVTAKENFSRRYPRFASLITILISAITFSIYFVAVGLILKEFNVSLATYLASASVIGLAIGFGSQGLVQDVVMGLTLIFSNALSVEDLVEVSGQTGKVKSIGLRFTTITSLEEQEIYIPNRNIGIIGRFKRGHVRLYVDVQIPEGPDEKELIREVLSAAAGMTHQYRSIILDDPENIGVREARQGNWRYLRLRFSLWPGQTDLIETTFKQRIITLLKKYSPEYMDWMVTITHGGD